MSRHRDVRCMNYSEEYEGYDDVYGHSVEDDYCVSPSAEQFLFDRSKQQNIASFIMEPDIIEDNEDSEEPPTPSNEEDIALTEMNKVRLMSCMESIKNVIGDTVPESEIKKKIIQSNFDAEAALDLVLKEPSPKIATGPPTVNKDNLEPHPDATSTMPQINSFIIPKLSFNKQENIGGTNENACHISNLESFKDLAINNSPMRLSSSFGFTTNLADSTLSNSGMNSSKNNSDTASFKSLADLVAHHLQKSNNLTDKINSNEKTFSLESNFVIPKLSIKKGNCSDLSNTQLDLCTTEKNKNVKSDVLSSTKTDDSMDSLERSLSSVLAFSKECHNPSIKNNSYNVESKEDSILNVSGTRTPSPDHGMIDLNSVLKEVTALVSNNYNHTKSKVPESANNVIPNFNLQTFNDDFEIPYIMLPTTLNLSCLRSVKLPYTKKNVSLFGKTLCRMWKLKKPILKPQQNPYKIIKRFDFSVPYTRT